MKLGSRLDRRQELESHKDCDDKRLELSCVEHLFQRSTGSRNTTGRPTWLTCFLWSWESWHEREQQVSNLAAVPMVLDTPLTSDHTIVKSLVADSSNAGDGPQRPT